MHHVTNLQLFCMLLIEEITHRSLDSYNRKENNIYLYSSIGFVQDFCLKKTNAHIQQTFLFEIAIWFAFMAKQKIAKFPRIISRNNVNKS